MGEAYFRKGDHHKAVECFQKSLSLLAKPLPSTKWKIRTSIVRELLIQLLHRLLPFLFVKKSGQPLDPETSELYRIYEVMGWIDYFMNRERLVLNVITGLNHAERKGSLSGVARGSMGMGLICDTLGIFRPAKFYSKRALFLSKQTDNPVILGLGYLGVAI